jgi:hypothetical protein
MCGLFISLYFLQASLKICLLHLLMLLSDFPFFSLLLLFFDHEDELADHPELYKDRSLQDDAVAGSKPADNSTDAAGRRQAATDEFMLERFRKRERHRVMRR